MPNQLDSYMYIGTCNYDYARLCFVGRLTIDDLKDIISEIRDARSKWEEIGLQLNIRKPDLDAIDKELRGNTQACLKEVITQWLKQVDPPPTWSAIISALNHPDVGYEQLAEEIVHKKLHPIENKVLPKNIPTKQESNGFKFLYKCGCGKSTCEIDLQCTELIPIDDTFPELSKLKDLSKDEIEVLNSRLKRDTKKIMLRFYDLLSSFYDSLRTRKVPVKQLVTHLSLIYAFEPVHTSSQSSLFQEHNDMLKKITDVEGVIDIIRLYSSFFNYEVLECMIGYDGSDVDKQNMKIYKEDLFHYSRRRMCEIQCPFYTGCADKEGHMNMVLKLDSKYDEYTLSSLREFRIMLAELFKITPQTLHLHKIDDGCIKLTFQIPHFVYKATFPLIAKQEESLLEMGILQLTCGTYHFPKENNQVCHQHYYTKCVHVEYQ